MSAAFAQWIVRAQKDLSGTIQQPNNGGRFAYIRPDAFPAERFYFSYKHWPVLLTQEPLQGRPVTFDLEPQSWDPKKTPVAVNVRLG